MADQTKPETVTIRNGVGMPAAMYLEEFGSQIWAAFGHPPYLVGTASHGKSWRDVDVRLILPDDEYAALGLGDPNYPHQSGKWVSLCMAYAALGRSMTGLPIDFQIQEQTRANVLYRGLRIALGVTLELRQSQHERALLAEVDALDDTPEQ